MQYLKLERKHEKGITVQTFLHLVIKAMKNEYLQPWNQTEFQKWNLESLV